MANSEAAQTATPTPAQPLIEHPSAQHRMKVAGVVNLERKLPSHSISITALCPRVGADRLSLTHIGFVGPGTRNRLQITDDIDASGHTLCLVVVLVAEKLEVCPFRHRVKKPFNRRAWLYFQIVNCAMYLHRGFALLVQHFHFTGENMRCKSIRREIMGVRARVVQDELVVRPSPECEGRGDESHFSVCGADADVDCRCFWPVTLFGVDSQGR